MKSKIRIIVNSLLFPCNSCEKRYNKAEIIIFQIL